MTSKTNMRPPLDISINRFFPRLGREILLLLCLAIPVAVLAADEGEVLSSAPVSQKTYTFTPGKLTGKQFWLENIEKKDKILCREFCFDQFLIYKKPADTVSVKLSLRGGYTSFNILGHTNFQLDVSANVTSGWVPQSSGSFIIYPDLSKEHLPKWVPERTKMIRVPFIKQYGETAVNAYDIALGLDRVNNGQLKTIDFQLVPITDDNGKQAIRLIPTITLTDGVYFAYSLPDNIDTDIYGFLFAVGTPSSGAVNAQPVDASKGYATLTAETASKVKDYALLSEAVYKDATVPNWEKVDAGNCPVDLGFLVCSLESAKTGIERKLYGFNAQAYQNKNDKRLVIAFRGSDQGIDFLVDYANAYLNGTPKQYQEALDFAEPLIIKFGKEGYKIILTGHSYGGGLASYAAIRLSRPSVSSVVFNAAGLGDGLIRATESLRDAQISDIERKMGEGLSTESQYLSDMLNTLISDAKLGINIPSITNIHLVGDPVALFPGQQAGIFTLLTVPDHFVWDDNEGKPVPKFSMIASLVPFDLVDRLHIVSGQYDSRLLGDFTDAAQLSQDYIKLLGEHKGLNVLSLPVEPHWMTNVINALKIKAANN